MGNNNKLTQLFQLQLKLILYYNKIDDEKQKQLIDKVIDLIFKKFEKISKGENYGKI